MSDLLEGLNQLERAAARLRAAVAEAHRGWRDKRFEEFVNLHVSELERVSDSTAKQMAQLLEVIKRAQQTIP